MSRTEKLYARLARLEMEYMRLVREEFQGQVDGLSTPWLRSRSGHGRWSSSNRFDPDDPAKLQHIDTLERNIITIRRKLGEEAPGPVVAIPLEILATYDGLGVLQTEGDWIRFMRDGLSRIDAISIPIMSE